MDLLTATAKRGRASTARPWRRSIVAALLLHRDSKRLRAPGDARGMRGALGRLRRGAARCTASNLNRSKGVGMDRACDSWMHLV